jgi:hypothetical protein
VDQLTDTEIFSVVDELDNSDKHKWLFRKMTRAQHKIFQIYNNQCSN